MLVEDIVRVPYGDANLDGRFDSADLIQVLQQGEYEDTQTENSGWSEGDWNGDGEFNTADLMLVLQLGHYSTDAIPLASIAAPAKQDPSAEQQVQTRGLRNLEDVGFARRHPRGTRRIQHRGTDQNDVSIDCHRLPELIEDLRIGGSELIELLARWHVEQVGGSGTDSRPIIEHRTDQHKISICGNR